MNYKPASDTNSCRTDQGVASRNGESDMRTNFYLLIMTITLLSSFGSGAPIDETAPSGHALSADDLVLNPISSIVYGIVCADGDTLNGEFRIVSDGDRFPGDQTKYDNWLLGGIDFLILDELNYGLWNQLEPITSHYERSDVAQLKWQFSVPSSGTWYLIYINNTIYMKQIESSITHRGSTDLSLPVVLGLLGLIVLLGLGLAQRTRKKQLWHLVPQHFTTTLW